MARKRPSKKHRGIRDPYKQQRVKYEKIKNKINNPPKDASIQEEPKKFKSFNIGGESEEYHRPPKKKKNDLINTEKFISKNVGFYPHDGKPFKQIPTVQQNKGETSYRFMRRVQEATQMVMKESKFQDKFKVDVKRNKIGQVERLQPRLTKEMEERKTRKRLKMKEWSLKKKLKKKRKKGCSGDASSQLNASLDENDENDEDDIDQRERNLFKKEYVSFDDIVHEPPSLDTEKLEQKVKEQKKIKTKSFLFSQKLEENEDQVSEEEVDNSKARQKILEMERERVILAYRQLQAKKRDATSFR